MDRNPLCIPNSYYNGMDSSEKWRVKELGQITKRLNSRRSRLSRGLNREKKYNFLFSPSSSSSHRIVQSSQMQFRKSCFCLVWDGDRMIFIHSFLHSFRFPFLFRSPFIHPKWNKEPLPVTTVTANFSLFLSSVWSLLFLICVLTSDSVLQLTHMHNAHVHSKLKLRKNALNFVCVFHTNCLSFFLVHGTWYKLGWLPWCLDVSVVSSSWREL